MKLRSLSITGKLIFDNKNIALDADWIRVNDGGHLIIGTEECKITEVSFFLFLYSYIQFKAFNRKSSLLYTVTEKILMTIMLDWIHMMIPLLEQNV